MSDPSQIDGLSSDVITPRIGQKLENVEDIFGPAHSFYRKPAYQGLNSSLRNVPNQGCLDWAGSDCIDCDAKFRQLAAHHLSQSFHRGFRCNVDGFALELKWHGDRGQIDDSSEFASPHQLCTFARDQECTAHVRAQDPFERDGG